MHHVTNLSRSRNSACASKPDGYPHDLIPTESSGQPVFVQHLLLRTPRTFGFRLNRSCAWQTQVMAGKRHDLQSNAHDRPEESGRRVQKLLLCLKNALGLERTRSDAQHGCSENAATHDRSSGRACCGHPSFGSDRQTCHRTTQRPCVGEVWRPAGKDRPRAEHFLGPMLPPETSP